MAFGCVALAYSLRYPDARGELFPNTFPLAVSYAIRERHSLVYAVVYDRQLRHHDRRLFQYVFLSPQKTYDSVDSFAPRNDSPKLSAIIPRQAFPIAGRAHVTHADREESKHRMNHLDDPVKFTGHERRLV